MQIRKRRGIACPKAVLLKSGPSLIIALAFLMYGCCWIMFRSEEDSALSSFYSESAASIYQQHSEGVPVLSRRKEDTSPKPYHPPYSSKPNAIIYMAQKSHKVYLRNSLALLERSLDLLFQNYLLIDHHYLNVTVFIFHTGDFDASDLTAWEQRYPIETKGTIQLIDLLNTPYWQVPDWLDEADLPNWRNPEFNIGYRHMIRWYAIRMWDYFAEINRVVGTNYKFIMRMDEESFFHSRINYDLFNYMGAHDYEYAYRICSYEMNAIQQIMHNYTGSAKRMWGDKWVRSRHWNGASCGFYNNWFIASLDFFMTDKVQHMLHWFDVQGYMYRDRLNDLVIQTAAVYNFCQPRKIHRFLDWTYEHFTLTKQGCPKWGALATGYNDDHANTTVSAFLRQLEVANCTMDQDSIRRQIPLLHVYYDYVADLSPTYNHLPMPEYENVTLVSIKAGRIDLPGRGERSG